MKNPTLREHLNNILPILGVVALLMAIIGMSATFQGCATTQTNLTPDQQKRAIVDAAAEALTAKWEQSLMWRSLKGPEADQLFEEKIRPAFKLAAQSLSDANELVQVEICTPQQIAAMVNQAMTKLLTVLTEQGVL